MRVSEIQRNTAETKISLTLNLDGTGKSSIDTGVGFLNHMLTLFAAHGKFDLTVTRTRCRKRTGTPGYGTPERRCKSRKSAGRRHRGWR